MLDFTLSIEPVVTMGLVTAVIHVLNLKKQRLQKCFTLHLVAFLTCICWHNLIEVLVSGRYEIFFEVSSFARICGLPHVEL